MYLSDAVAYQDLRLAVVIDLHELTCGFHLYLTGKTELRADSEIDPCHHLYFRLWQ